MSPPPPPSAHCRVTTGPPSLHQRHWTSPAPRWASSTLQHRRLPATVHLPRRQGEAYRIYGYTHRGTHIYDPNNGTRARLPLCNPNPNRVKEKRSKTGVADVTDYRSPPPPRGEKCHTAVLTGVRQENKRRTSVIGSEKR